MKTVTKLEAMPQITRRKRVAAYARVSSGKDAMKHSLSAQISYYSSLIQRRIEWEHAGVYADDAVSGTKDNRAEFQRLLSDCRAGSIDMVITKSITRFARNTVTTLETVRELKSIGVDVYFEKENIHSTSGDGELMLSILASYAQEESRSVSENQKWRIRKMFREGRTTVGRMLGYHLTGGKLCVVPEEAEIVRRVFSDYLLGLGVVAIRKKLREQGVFLSRTGISGILRNEKYAGNLLLQKTFRVDHISKRNRVNRGELPMYHIENSHEAIIPPVMFTMAQEELRKRSREKRAADVSGGYPFTGLIRCGKCGAPYRRKHTASGTKYEKIVWICGTFNELGKSVCDAQQIPENILMEKTANILGLPAFDVDILRTQITEIQVPEHNRLVFVFTDDSSAEVQWQNPSRRYSWTEEMKQTARERQQRIIAERRKQHER
ncbi:hypothetical protein FACS1894191_6420 [Clostridia bacterium]|nr:hypothetical protein FACS1894191_6420 [Clostridia bacterium]